MLQLSLTINFKNISNSVIMELINMSVDVKHERWKCIACGACAAVTPKFWVMDDNDFKADLIGSLHTNITEGLLETRTVDGDVQDEKDLKESEEACPVECIHVNKT